MGYLIAWLNTLEYRAFSNDYVPEILSIRTDFTEPTFAGYRPIKPKNWSGVFLNANANAQVNADPIRWVVDATAGADVIWGYFVVDPYGYVVYAERNPAGATSMQLAGQTFPMIPRFEAGTLC